MGNKTSDIIESTIVIDGNVLPPSGQYKILEDAAKGLGSHILSFHLFIDTEGLS